MQWLERLNEAIDYVEQNLDGVISYDHAARLAQCSAYHFQRMFSYITGVPLAEYIRRRRLTTAAFDLQNGGKVLDAALRYGYESPTAFTRAFRTLHGVTPSAAQKPGAVLKAYPRIAFQMSIKGDVEMEYNIIKKEAFRIVGVRDPVTGDYEQSFQRVPAFWQEVSQTDAIPKMCGLAAPGAPGVLGLSTCHSDGSQEYYYIGVITDRPAPEGMFAYTVPAATWAVFKGEGVMPDAIQALQKRIFAEWLPASGYDWAKAPDIEVYPDPPGGNVHFEVWLPIVKK